MGGPRVDLTADEIVEALKAGYTCLDVASTRQVSPSLVYLRLTEAGLRARDFAHYRRPITRAVTVTSTQREAQLSTLPASPAWMLAAACAGADDPDLFFPLPRDKDGIRAARNACSPCDVKDECLAYALAADERYGVWGGLTPNQRSRRQHQNDSEGATA